MRTRPELRITAVAFGASRGSTGGRVGNWPSRPGSAYFGWKRLIAGGPFFALLASTTYTSPDDGPAELSTATPATSPNSLPGTAVPHQIPNNTYPPSP